MANIRQNNATSLLGIVRSRTTLFGLLFLVPMYVFLGDSAIVAVESVESVPVQAANQNNWGAPKVQVFQRQGKWIIEGQRNRIELNPSDLQMTVYAQSRTWSMIPSFRGDLIVENSGTRLSLRLADAEKKEISPYQTGFKTGIKIGLEDFAHKDIKVDPVRKQRLTSNGVDVQISLFVYHDALLLPWSLGKGAWGIPENDLGYLHGLANAGLAYLSLNPGEKELVRVRTMSALHERVGLLEMTNHEFLEESFRKQRTTFADGTKVTIDLDSDTFEISPKLPMPTN